MILELILFIILFSVGLSGIGYVRANSCSIENECNMISLWLEVKKHSQAVCIPTCNICIDLYDIIVPTMPSHPSTCIGYMPIVSIFGCSLNVEANGGGWVVHASETSVPALHPVFSTMQEII